MQLSQPAELSSKEYSDVFGLLTRIQKCTQRNDLQAIVRDDIIPLLQEGYSYFDRRGVQNEDAPLMACPGIFKDDRALIQKYLKKDTLTRMMLTQQDRDEPLSLRSQSILQWIIPQVMHKIKCLMVNEELTKSRATVETLMKSPVGIALVNEEKILVSCNKPFRDLFQVLAKDPIPESLEKFFDKENPASDLEETENQDGTEISFFTLPQGNFKLVYYRLDTRNPDIEKLWLLRIHPASDPFTKSNMLIQKAGLTWREMEICCLIHDGLGRQEIAERLFISAHTVKTHLKKIHKKLGVNSRTQLVAYLNQHSDDSFEKQFS